MLATGYFTIERNLMGRTLGEIERTLGFRPGRFDSGVQFLELLRRPALNEFELGGSTWYANRQGLDSTRLAPRTIPFAWTNERLIKVKPLLEHTDGELYPKAPLSGASEQWFLKTPIPAREICTLRKGSTYWGRSK